MSGFGWKPEPYDPRDKAYHSPDGLMEERIDLSKSQPEWLLNVYQQQDSSSCVANATAAAYRWTAHKQGLTGGSSDPSRLYIYYGARMIPGIPSNMLEPGKGKTVDAFQCFSVKKPDGFMDPDGGSENRNAFRAMNLFGVCSEPDWPWLDTTVTPPGRTPMTLPDKLNDSPDEARCKLAQGGTAIHYSRLDPDHPPELEQSLTDDQRVAVGEKTLMHLKQCLSEGYPVVLGFWFYYDVSKDIEIAFEVDKDGYKVLKEIPVERRHKGPSPNYGGHTVLCIGYDNARRQVLCQNSWGEKWSQKGKFWMSYDYVSDWEATDDFWMIRRIAKREDQENQ